MSVAASNQTCHLSPPLLECPFPQFHIYPYSTVCGSKLFPQHLTSVVDCKKLLSDCGPWDSRSRCDKQLKHFSDYAFKEIMENINKAGNNGRDTMYVKFLAAMGYNWYEDTKAARQLPEVPADKIQIKKIDYFETYIVIKPEDMTAPVMRGVSFCNKLPPYDDRPFFAVKVVDVGTQEVFAQTFHRRYASDNEPLGYWTTYGGVLIPERGVRITQEQLFPLAQLFRGEAITTPEGRHVRLSCENDLPTGAVDEKEMLEQLEQSGKPASLCGRISALFSRFFHR